MRESLVLLALLGCSSGKSSFERLSSDVNPILQKLRPVALDVASLAKDDSARSKLVERCKSVYDVLADLDAHKESFLAVLPSGDKAHPYNAPLTVKGMLNERLGLCGSGGDEFVCAKSCVDEWNALANNIDRLNELAPKGSPKLLSLR